MFSFFLSILAICFIVFFHELGHFIVARLCGVGIKVFSIGFGNKLFSKRYGDTEFILSSIPLGGYVEFKSTASREVSSMYSVDTRDFLETQSRFKRILIFFSGSFFNFLLSFLLLFFIGFFGVFQGSCIVGKPLEGSIESVGIPFDDKIVPTGVGTWGDVNRSILNRVVEVDRVRFNQYYFPESLAFSVSAQNMSVRKEDSLVQVMVIPSEETYRVQYNFFHAMDFALTNLLVFFQSISKALLGLIFGFYSFSELSGVISIVHAMTKIEVGYGCYFLFYMALISTHLGVLNLLPLPILDGGKILFTLLDRVRAQIVFRIRFVLNILGFSIFSILLLLSLYNDVTQIWFHGI